MIVTGFQGPGFGSVGSPICPGGPAPKVPAKLQLGSLSYTREET